MVIEIRQIIASDQEIDISIFRLVYKRTECLLIFLCDPGKETSAQIICGIYSVENSRDIACETDPVETAIRVIMRYCRNLYPECPVTDLQRASDLILVVSGRSLDMLPVYHVEEIIKPLAIEDQLLRCLQCLAICQ